MRVFLPLALALVAAGCATVQSNTQPWPAAEKRALVQECEAQIWQRVENDYRSQRNAGQLPAGFRESMAAKVQPSLERCACFIDRLESEWSYEELARRSAHVGDKVTQISESGACAPSGKR